MAYSLDSVPAGDYILEYHLEDLYTFSQGSRPTLLMTPFQGCIVDASKIVLLAQPFRKSASDNQSTTTHHKLLSSKSPERAQAIAQDGSPAGLAINPREP